MNATDQAIVDFWVTFVELKDELEVLDSAESPVYDRLMESLEKIHEELYYEYCPNPGSSELIITADGNPELFDLVEDIVTQAPIVNGWTFLALKPKRGLPKSTRWENVRINSDAVYYEIVMRQSTNELGLKLYVADLLEEDFDAAHNALLRMIDSYLGERRFAETISATWVHSVSEDEISKLFPLDTLENQLNNLSSAS